MIESGKPLPKQLHTVQALRGLAALLVLVLHIAGMQRGILGIEKAQGFDGFWNRGFSGVDLFFVISGFIMVYVTRDLPAGLSSAMRFIKARFIRIYPLWWFYAGLMALIYFLIFGIPARPEYAAEAGGVWPYMIKSFLLLPQQVLPVIDVGWTLTYEMYYYFIMAAILLMPRRALPYALMLWAAQILAFQYLTFDHPALKIMKSPLSLEFIGGAFMALLVLRGVIIWPRLILLIGGACFCAGLMLPDVSSVMWKGWGRVIIFGLPSLAIIYALVSLERVRGLQPPRALIALGDWSYSLYLGHIIILLVMKNIWEILERIGMPAMFKLSASGLWDNIAFAIASIGAAIFAAMLSYILVERPIIRLLKRPSPDKD